MTPSTDPHVRAIVCALRGRTRISFTYLAYLTKIQPRVLPRYLAHRKIRDAWTVTDSKSLGLPALEAFPFSVQFLVRN
jgi:hypothetical protein